MAVVGCWPLPKGKSGGQHEDSAASRKCLRVIRRNPEALAKAPWFKFVVEFSLPVLIFNSGEPQHFRAALFFQCGDDGLFSSLGRKQCGQHDHWPDWGFSRSGFQQWMIASIPQANRHRAEFINEHFKTCRIPVTEICF